MGYKDTSLMMLVIIIIAQLIPTPVWPDLTNPTPYMTTTPVPSPTLFSTPTGIVTNTPFPTAAATLEVPQDEVLDSLSTAQSNLDDLQDSVSISGEQIYFGGNPLLTDWSGTTIFGYMKWLMSTGNEAIFGPFAPITWTLSVLLLLMMMSLVMYGVRVAVSLLFRFGWWVISTVLRFIPFIG